MPEMRNDLPTRMSHENKLDVLIYAQPCFSGNRMNQKWQATLVMVGLEMLKNRGERRAFLIRD